MPSDKCSQYQQDFEKLLELKQGFDEALAEGERGRDFGEVMRLKDELDKAIINLERDLKFKVWKTIELGTGLKTGDDFIGALKDGGYTISNSAKSIMEKPEFTTLSEKIKFELVIVSAAELGFPESVTLEEIYKRAKEMGLELCPPEVGLQLRLQYKNQPTDEWLNIAMDQIRNSGGELYVFRVERNNDDLRLCAYYSDSGPVWSPDSRWVFVRRKLT